MKTKNIFKALALAMLMPAILLTTACSSDDDAINENTNKKGYTLHVTVNVTRQGDDATTRASFNDGTKKLSFSAGDKLYIEGRNSESTAGNFSGTLDWVSEGTFSGTITTTGPYSGTADELFSQAAFYDYVHATLLPAGYDTYGFLYFDEGLLRWNDNNTFATSKATAVEQFSFETASTYSSGFALSPQKAILNFTITGLTANASNVAVSFADNLSNVISGEVDTDGSGTATFAVGIDYKDLNDCSLTVGGKAITLVSSSKELFPGHIYNISRTAPATTTITWTASDMTTPGIMINFDGGEAYNNEIKGITVDASGAAEGVWQYNSIDVMTGSTTITFYAPTGSNITSIVITADFIYGIYEDQYPAGWTPNELEANPRTLTWSGDASSAVTLMLTNDQGIDRISQIVFTLKSDD